MKREASSKCIGGQNSIPTTSGSDCLGVVLPVITGFEFDELSIIDQKWMRRKMTRVFRIGEEIKVFVDEEFDIRIDDAPQGIYAQPGDEGLLTISGSTGDRQEGGFTFFHFTAIAPGVQKVEFPPTMLRQTVEIQNMIGAPNVERADEVAGTQPLLGTDFIPPLVLSLEPADILPIN